MSPSCAKGESPDVPIQAYSAEADEETCAGALERTSLTSASAPHTTMHSVSSASPNSKRAEAAAAAAEGGNLVGRNVDPESVGIEAGCNTVIRSSALLIALCRFSSVRGWKSGNDFLVLRKSRYNLDIDRNCRELPGAHTRRPVLIFSCTAHNDRREQE